MLVVPVEHPAQVAAAVTGAAPEPEPELRFPPSPDGRISGRRKVTPTRRHGEVSRRPLLSSTTRAELSSSLLPLRHCPFGTPLSGERVGATDWADGCGGELESHVCGGASRVVAERVRSNTTR